MKFYSKLQILPKLPAFASLLCHLCEFIYYRITSKLKLKTSHICISFMAIIPCSDPKDWDVKLPQTYVCVFKGFLGPAQKGKFKPSGGPKNKHPFPERSFLISPMTGIVEAKGYGWRSQKSWKDGRETKRTSWLAWTSMLSCIFYAQISGKPVMNPSPAPTPH